MKADIRFILAVVILSVVSIFVYVNVFSIPKDVPTRKKELPSKISDWTAKNVKYDQELLKVLFADRIIYKTYHDGSNNPSITLFIAYYKTLEKADFSHSPIVCFTGQGWEIQKKDKIEIPIDRSDIDKIKVNQLVQNKLGTNMITLFWYQSANHAFANRGIQKLSMFFDRLFGKPDDNAFVRVTLVVPRGEELKEVAVYLYRFVRQLYPELTNIFRV